MGAFDRSEGMRVAAAATQPFSGDFTMTHAAIPYRNSADSEARANPAKEAFQLLHWGFAALLAVAGVDKLTHMLADWDLYLAPGIPHAFATVARPFMTGVGIVELGLALLVGLRPRIGAAAVASWFAAVIIDLLMLGAHYDIVIGDFGLVLGACALQRLALARDRGEIIV
jgi:uncharacterized membrane protein YphA (DoxX/SURF4 family)